MPTATFAEQWKALHGLDLPRAALDAAPDAGAQNAQWRPADFLDQPNVFLAAVLAAQAGDKLPLWEPLANLVPAHSLDTGDALLLHVPPAPGPLPWVVWDHARDAIAAPLPADLGGRSPGDPANPVRFASRAAWLAEALARGRLDLDLFLPALELNVAVNDQLKGNVRVFPPTGVYIPWHLYFCGRDAELRALLEVAAQSPARFIRDSAALLHELLAGRTALGAVTEFVALRAEAAALAQNPVRRATLLAARTRADTDKRLAAQKGPRLSRRDAPPASEAMPEPSIPAGDLELSVRSTRGRVALAASRHGRVLSARDIAGGRLAPTEALGSLLYRAGPGLAALIQPFAPGAQPTPRKGAVSVFGVQANQVQLVAAFQLDATHFERHGEALVVRASDGSAYAFDGLEQGPAPGAWSPPRPPPLPGAQVAAPPPAFAADALDGLRLELTPTSLIAYRGPTRLWEEPLVEAYAMALLPARRLVAVHRLSDELRPVLDVLYLRQLDAPVAAGEGCASWVSWPIDGREFELRSNGAHLFVCEDGAWKRVDDAAFEQPPQYLKARGWL